MINLTLNGALYIVFWPEQVFSCLDHAARIHLEGMPGEIICNTLHLRPVNKITVVFLSTGRG